MSIGRVPSFIIFCALLRLEERRRPECNRSDQHAPLHQPRPKHHLLLRPSDRRRAHTLTGLVRTNPSSPAQSPRFPKTVLIPCPTTPYSKACVPLPTGRVRTNRARPRVYGGGLSPPHTNQGANHAHHHTIRTSKRQTYSRPPRRPPRPHQHPPPDLPHPRHHPRRAPSHHHLRRLPAGNRPPRHHHQRPHGRDRIKHQAPNPVPPTHHRPRRLPRRRRHGPGHHRPRPTTRRHQIPLPRNRAQGAPRITPRAHAHPDTTPPRSAPGS
jgi:hypothetical protein